jgi:hypothetical protein
MNDIMIDLETLSTHKNARIMTMAAVRFDIKTGEIGENIHIGLHKIGADYIQSHVSPDTLEFWLDDAQAASLDRIWKLVNANPYSTARALEKLTRFIDKKSFDAIWSNGSSFDLSILNSAYNAYSQKTPWKYWQERDTRTIVGVSRKITGIDPKKQVTFEGQPHDALCDAIYQARYVHAAYTQLLQKPTA